jgi:hypothetical protein
VGKNLKKAFKLFSDASRYGRADATYKLGLMYETGQGIKKNLKKAIRNYQKSAKKGYPLAQYRFGLMYEKGLGVKQNPINAYAWLVVAGHFFIYGTTEEPSFIEHNFDECLASTSNNSFQSQLTQQKEKETVLDEIIKHLQGLKKGMSTDDLEKSKRQVLKISKYSKRYNADNVKNINKKSNIDNLFFLDTLH